MGFARTRLKEQKLRLETFCLKSTKAENSKGLKNIMLQNYTKQGNMIRILSSSYFMVARADRTTGLEEATTLKGLPSERARDGFAK